MLLYEGGLAVDFGAVAAQTYSTMANTMRLGIAGGLCGGFAMRVIVADTDSRVAMATATTTTAATPPRAMQCDCTSTGLWAAAVARQPHEFMCWLAARRRARTFAAWSLEHTSMQNHPLLLFHYATRSTTTTTTTATATTTNMSIMMPRQMNDAIALETVEGVLMLLLLVVMALDELVA